jgi:hypothetical protein
LSLPWEEDFPASPWEEVSGSGVAVTVEALVSEASLAKAVCSPSHALSLIRRGFFGPRAVSPSPSGVEASLSSKGKDPLPENGLLRRGFLGSNFASSSLLEKSSKQDAKIDDGEVRVCSTVSSNGAVAVLTPMFPSLNWCIPGGSKDEVAKQLLKNKDLLTKVVADILVEGYSKEVIDTMNFAPMVGLSWGGDDKRLSSLFSVIEKEKREPAAPKVKGKRELKNLACSLNIEARGWRSS